MRVSIFNTVCKCRYRQQESSVVRGRRYFCQLISNQSLRAMCQGTWYAIFRHKTNCTLLLNNVILYSEIHLLVALYDTYSSINIFKYYT